MSSIQPYTTIYIVRHGRTDANDAHEIQGSFNFSPRNDLNSQGAQEAQALAQKLQDVAFDEVFSSDLNRAIQTCNIITKGREFIVDTRIRERDWKVWEGRPMSEFVEETDRKDTESDDEVRNRATEFLNEIAKKHLGKTVLVVCHGGLMRNVLIRLLNLSCKVEDIKAGNTSYYTLKYSSDNGWEYGERSEGVALPSEPLLSA